MLKLFRICKCGNRSEYANNVPVCIYATHSHAEVVQNMQKHAHAECRTMLRFTSHGTWLMYSQASRSSSAEETLGIFDGGVQCVKWRGVT